MKHWRDEILEIQEQKEMAQGKLQTELLRKVLLYGGLDRRTHWDMLFAIGEPPDRSDLPDDYPLMRRFLN